MRVARSLWLFTMLLGQSFFFCERDDRFGGKRGEEGGGGIDMVAKEARSSGWVIMRGSGWI